MPSTQRTSPWLLLFLRPGLFLLVQAALAASFALLGTPAPWERAADAWPLIVALANLLCLGVLLRVLHAEGRRYRDIFRIERSRLKGDLLALLGLTILAAPLTVLPNVLLGQWLFGASDAVLPLFIRPMPLWAVYLAMVFFPVSQGATELATYFGVVKPALDAQGLRPWLAVGLPSLLLGLQHVAVPLLFDARFIIWRALMYLPFAFLIGIAFYRRPGLLPYFSVIHVLMNVSTASLFLSAAT